MFYNGSKDVSYFRGFLNEIADLRRPDKSGIPNQTQPKIRFSRFFEGGAHFENEIIFGETALGFFDIGCDGS